MPVGGTLLAGCAVVGCGGAGYKSLTLAKSRSGSAPPSKGSTGARNAKDEEMVKSAMANDHIKRIQTNTENVVRQIHQAGLDAPDRERRASSRLALPRAMTEGAIPIIQPPETSPASEELLVVQEENDKLREELASLTARKCEIEANLILLSQRLEKLEDTSAAKEEVIPAPAFPVSTPTPSKPREPAVAQLEEALHYADQALQGILMEPRGDAAAGAMPDGLVGAGPLREALAGLTSATPTMETRIAGTIGLLKERLGIAPAPSWGSRAPAQDFEVGDTCEGQDCNARWWPVLITTKNMDGTFTCDVADGFTSKWRGIRKESLRQAVPAPPAASAQLRSPRRQVQGELEMVQQQLMEVQAHNRTITNLHQELNDQHQVLTSQHQSLSLQHRDLTQAQAVTQAEFRRSAQELEALREQTNLSASAQAQELLAARTRHKELMQVVDEQKLQLREHHAAKESTSGLLAQLQKRLQEQDDQLAELPVLRAQHDEHKEQAELANGKAQAMQAELEELINHHAAEQEMLKEQHQAQIEIQCAAAAKEAAARALEFAHLDDRPKQTEDLLRQEQQNNAVLRSQLERAESQLDAFRERIITSEKLQKERDDMRNRLVAATRKLEDVSRSAAASAAAVQMPLFGMQRGSNTTRPHSPSESRGEPAQQPSRGSGAGLNPALRGLSPGASLSASSRAAKPPSSNVEDASGGELNVSGAVGLANSRIVTPQLVSGIHTPSEVGERSMDRSFSQGMSGSPKMEGWRAMPGSPHNASGVSPSLSSSFRTRRGSEGMSEMTAAAPRGAPPPPMAYQASPLRRSTSSDYPGVRSTSQPQQNSGILMGSMPKTQVRYLSPGPPASAPVVTMAAPLPATSMASPLPSPQAAPGHASPAAPLLSHMQAPVQTQAKAPMPFMMGSQLASGFLSPLAYRGAASYTAAPSAPQQPQPLASNAREVLSRNGPVSPWPMSYSADATRQQSPAFRFAAAS